MLTIQHSSTSKVLHDVVSSFSYDSEIVTLQALLVNLSKHDHETSTHARRMVRWTLAIAHHLGLPKQEVYRFCLAALLHDIGKLEIPQPLLHKRGPLTTEEWNLVHRHPEIGAAMLQVAGGTFVTLVPLVLAHHERWNGSGYPFGLQKESIPLGARVLAVVDSFDAMTERRPYHVGISFNEACAELEQQAGILYDPCVVASFLSVLNMHPATPHVKAYPQLAA